MGKTTLKDKIGYGFASMGDAVGYGLIGTFLLFFLTTVAGISPGIAGTIAAIGSIWNAIVNPVVGYFADKVRTRFGKRRPLIFFFSIPLLLTMFLLFTNIQIPMAVKPIYYGILLMLYWTSYTGFMVPYLALGADYTADYDDRTILRLFGSFFNMLGSMLTMVMPTMIVAFLQQAGLSMSQAWSVTGLLLGIITFVTNMITVVASRHKDLPVEREKVSGEKGVRSENRQRSYGARKVVFDILREYISVARLEPMKYLVAASLVALVGYTLVTSNMVYYLTFKQGLSSVEISGCMLARTLISAAFIPIVGRLILATDRRETLMGCYLLGAVGMCLIKWIDFPSGAELVLYLFVSSICTSIYWQVMPGIFYDICEYDRIVNGKSRSATIVSFQGLVEAFAAGIGGQLLGLILEFAGFNGADAVQSTTAQLWIENSGTIIPVIFLLLTCIALYKYPLSKKVYNELLESEKESKK